MEWLFTMINDASHHKPYPVEKMKNKNPKNTICETLRQAYQAVEDGDTGAAMLKIRVAVTMARAMNQKLKEYKATA